MCAGIDRCVQMRFLLGLTLDCTPPSMMDEEGHHDSSTVSVNLSPVEAFALLPETNIDQISLMLWRV